MNINSKIANDIPKWSVNWYLFNHVIFMHIYIIIQYWTFWKFSYFTKLKMELWPLIAIFILGVPFNLWDMPSTISMHNMTISSWLCIAPCIRVIYFVSCYLLCSVRFRRRGSTTIPRQLLRPSLSTRQELT